MPDLLAPTGAIARSTLSCEPPSGSSPFFGWLDPDGEPVTVRIDHITAHYTNGQNGRLYLVMNTGGQFELPDEARRRLLKRMGWAFNNLVQR